MCLFSITLTYISYCHFDVSYLVKPIFVLARYIYIYIYIYIIVIIRGPLNRLLRSEVIAILLVCHSYVYVFIFYHRRF